MKTIVYIDGFNFYYSAVKGKPYKWLDLGKMCQVLLPKNQIVQIKYFTARVKARPHDPGQPQRQDIYIRALRTIPNLEIIFGRFISKPRKFPLVSSTTHPPQMTTVLYTEEKGSDVNLAIHLLNDGHKGLYQVAVVVSNDSDLVESLRIVRQELNLTVGILNPQKTTSNHLRKNSDFVKSIRPSVLKACQFPGTLQDAKGSITKPPGW